MKERGFTTPLQLAPKRPLSDEPAERPPKVPRTDAAAREKGKVKPKGVAGGGNKCAPKTPEGKGICFAFNAKRGCKNKACRFVHVCGKCFKVNVPMHECDHAA